MNALYQLTSQAIEDLDAIWWTIAEDNRDAAEQVPRHTGAGEVEILATCQRLARHPRIGAKRQDITMLPVRFWTITKFPNYVIVYRPETNPLQVVAVLHGKRDLREVLGQRS
jgi:plasmid stabilization system protein ParE